MSVKNNQLETPFTTSDKAKLDAIDEGAKTYSVATQAEAEAGTDNVKLMTPLRVAEAIAILGNEANSAKAINNQYRNNTGSTLQSLTVVKQDVLGMMAAIDPSVESDINSILGVLTQNTAQGAYGTVILSGLIENVSSAFLLTNIIYLSKSGGLTTTVPEIGSAGFVVGDFVVKVGKITKNSTNGSLLDLKVELEVKGQL